MSAETPTSWFTLPRVVALALVAVAFIAAAAAYSSLPDRVATHWNAAGEADGYMSTNGIWLLPCVMLGVGLLLFVLPGIMPLRANIESFRRQYDWFVALFEGFMLLVFGQTLLWNLGIRISPNVLLPLGLGVLFIYVGWMFGQAKRNWVFGIRTSWTLSSDEVWDETHRFAGKLWIGAGAVSMLGVLWPDYAVWFILVPVSVAAVVSVYYSYRVWVRLGRPGDGEASGSPTPQ